MHLVAAPSYVAHHGVPDSIEDLHNHWFIGHDSADSRAPFFRWLSDVVPQNRIVFRTTDNRVMVDAVLAGAGIGFVSTWEMRQHPELVEVIPSQDAWSGTLWLVTHVDLHRTTKVQAFLSFLKKEAESWDI